MTQKAREDCLLLEASKGEIEGVGCMIGDKIQLILMVRAASLKRMQKLASKDGLKSIADNMKSTVRAESNGAKSKDSHG